MPVSITIRIDEALDQRVRDEAARRHKANISDMLRDLIAHGFAGLPPIREAEDLSPLPDARIAAALRNRTAEEFAEDHALAGACSRPKGDWA